MIDWGWHSEGNDPRHKLLFNDLKFDLYIVRVASFSCEIGYLLWYLHILQLWLQANLSVLTQILPPQWSLPWRQRGQGVTDWFNSVSITFCILLIQLNQKTFTEHLLCVRHDTRYWGYKFTHDIVLAFEELTVYLAVFTSVSSASN